MTRVSERLAMFERDSAAAAADNSASTRTSRTAGSTSTSSSSRRGQQQQERRRSFGAGDPALSQNSSSSKPQQQHALVSPQRYAKSKVNTATLSSSSTSSNEADEAERERLAAQKRAVAAFAYDDNDDDEVTVLDLTTDDEAPLDKNATIEKRKKRRPKKTTPPSTPTTSKKKSVTIGTSEIVDEVFPPPSPERPIKSKATSVGGGGTSSPKRSSKESKKKESTTTAASAEDSSKRKKKEKSTSATPSSPKVKKKKPKAKADDDNNDFDDEDELSPVEKSPKSPKQKVKVKSAHTTTSSSSSPTKSATTATMSIVSSAVTSSATPKVSNKKKAKASLSHLSSPSKSPSKKDSSSPSKKDTTSTKSPSSRKSRTTSDDVAAALPSISLEEDGKHLASAAARSSDNMTDKKAATEEEKSPPSSPKKTKTIADETETESSSPPSSPKKTKIVKKKKVILVRRKKKKPESDEKETQQDPTAASESNNKNDIHDEKKNHGKEKNYGDDEEEEKDAAVDSTRHSNDLGKSKGGDKTVEKLWDYFGTGPNLMMDESTHTAAIYQAAVAAKPPVEKIDESKKIEKNDATRLQQQKTEKATTTTATTTTLTADVGIKEMGEETPEETVEEDVSKKKIENETEHTTAPSAETIETSAAQCQHDTTQKDTTEEEPSLEKTSGHSKPRSGEKTCDEKTQNDTILAVEQDQQNDVDYGYGNEKTLIPCFEQQARALAGRRSSLENKSQYKSPVNVRDRLKLFDKGGSGAPVTPDLDSSRSRPKSPPGFVASRMKALGSREAAPPSPVRGRRIDPNRFQSFQASASAFLPHSGDTSSIDSSSVRSASSLKGKQLENLQSTSSVETNTIEPASRPIQAGSFLKKVDSEGEALSSDISPSVAERMGTKKASIELEELPVVSPQPKELQKTDEKQTLPSEESSREAPAFENENIAAMTKVCAVPTESKETVQENEKQSSSFGESSSEKFVVEKDPLAQPEVVSPEAEEQAKTDDIDSECKTPSPQEDSSMAEYMAEKSHTKSNLPNKLPSEHETTTAEKGGGQPEKNSSTSFNLKATNAVDPSLPMNTDVGDVAKPGENHKIDAIESYEEISKECALESESKKPTTELFIVQEQAILQDSASIKKSNDADALHNNFVKRSHSDDSSTYGPQPANHVPRRKTRDRTDSQIDNDSTSSGEDSTSVSPTKLERSHIPQQPIEDDTSADKPEFPQTVSDPGDQVKRLESSEYEDITIESLGDGRVKDKKSEEYEEITIDTAPQKAREKPQPRRAARRPSTLGIRRSDSGISLVTEADFTTDEERKVEKRLKKALDEITAIQKLLEDKQDEVKELQKRKAELQEERLRRMEYGDDDFSSEDELCVNAEEEDEKIQPLMATNSASTDASKLTAEEQREWNRKKLKRLKSIQLRREKKNEEIRQLAVQEAQIHQLEAKAVDCEYEEITVEDGEDEDEICEWDRAKERRLASIRERLEVKTREVHILNEKEKEVHTLSGLSPEPDSLTVEVELDDFDSYASDDEEEEWIRAKMHHLELLHGSLDQKNEELIFLEKQKEKLDLATANNVTEEENDDDWERGKIRRLNSLYGHLEDADQELKKLDSESCDEMISTQTLADNKSSDRNDDDAWERAKVRRLHVLQQHVQAKNEELQQLEYEVGHSVKSYHVDNSDVARGPHDGEGASGSEQNWRISKIRRRNSLCGHLERKNNELEFLRGQLMGVTRAQKEEEEAEYYAAATDAQKHTESKVSILPDEYKQQLSEQIVNVKYTPSGGASTQEEEKDGQECSDSDSDEESDSESEKEKLNRLNALYSQLEYKEKEIIQLHQETQSGGSPHDDHAPTSVQEEEYNDDGGAHNNDGAVKEQSQPKVASDDSNTQVVERYAEVEEWTVGEESFEEKTFHEKKVHEVVEEDVDEEEGYEDLYEEEQYDEQTVEEVLHDDDDEVSEDEDEEDDDSSVEEESVDEATVEDDAVSVEGGMTA